MRHFAIVACLFLVLSVSVIARADNDYDNIWFEERDTNSTTSDTTGSMSTTGSSTTGGSSTQVYDVSLGDQNVTVSIPVTGNHTLKIQFPAIGNFSAKYSGAGADIADYADPDATKPSGVSFKGASFFITLYYPNGSKVEGFTFPEPIIVTIGVDGVSDDDALYLYDTETETWTDAASTCDTPSTQVVDGNLVVAICHLTQFAVFETITTANLGAKSHNTSGLIAAVIIIPIVIVGVIIALVAWTLLRKPHKRSKSERDLEMEKTEKSSSKRELTKEIESDSDTETDSSADEKPAPKEEKKPEEKKAEPVIELKKATSNSSDDSDTDSSSDSSEREELKKKAEEKKKRESSDTDTDTDTDSDE